MMYMGLIVGGVEGHLLPLFVLIHHHRTRKFGKSCQKLKGKLCYRAMNSGRFPSASGVKKEVGGSYYVIRKIVQELEHESKISSMKSTSESSLGKEVAEENEPLNEDEEVSSNQMTVDADILHNAQMRGGTLLGKEVTKCVNSEHVAMQSHLLKGEAEEVLHPCPEKPKENIKLKSSSEAKQDFEERKPGQQQELFELEESERVSPKEQTNDEKLQKRSSVWGSLKSFAGGIINIWRKL